MKKVKVEMPTGVSTFVFYNIFLHDIKESESE